MVTRRIETSRHCDSNRASRRERRLKGRPRWLSRWPSVTTLWHAPASGASRRSHTAGGAEERQSQRRLLQQGAAKGKRLKANASKLAPLSSRARTRAKPPPLPACNERSRVSVSPLCVDPAKVPPPVRRRLSRPGCRSRRAGASARQARAQRSSSYLGAARASPILL